MVPKFDPINENIEKIKSILNNDGVISIPTDTVYGLCAKMTSEKGYKKIMDLKKRPPEKALPIMCCSKNQIEQIAIINQTAKILIKKFMPGPLTIILDKKENLPQFINPRKKYFSN